jgi:hemerythrin-like domain-containing protein
MTSTAAPQPDTTEMLAVHRALRNALAAAPVLVGDVKSGDRARLELIADYFDNVIAFLAVHHHGEDLLMFPLLRERCPGETDAIDRVNAQHHDVDDAVAEVTELLARWPTDDDLPSRLGASLAELGDRLTEHLDDEEREMLPLCAVHLSMEEWGAMPAHAMGNFPGDKPWLILGLVFEQMSPAQKQNVLDHMPSPALEMWTTMGEGAFGALIAEVRVAAVPAPLD